MAQRFSQNGWPAYADASHFTRATATCSGGALGFWAANDDVAVVFREFIERFDREVEPVVQAKLDDWSYANRLVRGSTTTVSNHGSATAIDLNALKHPRGVRNTFSLGDVARLQTIRRSLTDSSGVAVLRWGGDFSSTVDDMHIEVNASTARMKQAANKIRAAKAAQKENDMPLVNADVELIVGHPTDLVGQSLGGAVKTTLDRVDADNLQAQVRDGIERAMQDSSHPLTVRLVKLQSALDQILAALAPPPA